MAHSQGFLEIYREACKANPAIRKPDSLQKEASYEEGKQTVSS
jgi:hypothetical protein